MPGLRILIAEDDPVSATLMGMLVEAEGHRVCGTVTEGGHVLEAVQGLKPDVVLMDVQLADDVSGISATQRLLRTVSVPVIVVSGTESREDMEGIANSGALGFIKKPISADELRVNLRIATHHNEIMRKLHDSELLHRSIFDNAAVGIYLCHPDGYFLASNQAFARMLGYAGPAELLRLVHSLDDQLYADEGRRQELLDRLRHGDEVMHFESRVYGRDGDLLWVAEHLMPSFDESGTLQHYEGVIINITDRKEAEAARQLAYNMLQSTVDAIADGVVVTDLECNIILSNKAFDDQWSMHTEPTRVLRLQTNDDADLLQRFFAQAAESPSEPPKLRDWVRFPGTPNSLDATVSPYSTAAGGVIGAVLVLRPEARE